MLLTAPSIVSIPQTTLKPSLVAALYEVLEAQTQALTKLTVTSIPTTTIIPTQFRELYAEPNLPVTGRPTLPVTRPPRSTPTPTVPKDIAKETRAHLQAEELRRMEQFTSQRPTHPTTTTWPSNDDEFFLRCLAEKTGGRVSTTTCL